MNESMRAVHCFLAAAVPVALLSVACFASAAGRAKEADEGKSAGARAGNAGNAAKPTAPAPKNAPTAPRASATPTPTPPPPHAPPAPTSSARTEPSTEHAPAAPRTSATPAPSPEAPAAKSESAPSSTKSEKVSALAPDGKTRTCREQSAQPFLIRGSWFPHTKDAEELKQGRKLLEQAIRYRTEQYGYFEGFGNPKWNKHPPKFYAKDTTFLGLTLRVHERIIPALKCVEAALVASGAASEYKPRTSSGIRYKNTYRGVEVSNHVYGIAVDIEPDRNSCCGCVAPWPNHPLCKAKNKTVWERMAMPKSWVDVFERYGFYWLGHDVLQDTMHFEFLGDPDKIFEGTETVATSP